MYLVLPQATWHLETWFSDGIDSDGLTLGLGHLSIFSNLKHSMIRISTEWRKESLSYKTTDEY